MAVNLLIDPFNVRAVGQQAMLDFGWALASGTAFVHLSARHQLIPR